MTFAAFQATRTETADLGAVLNDDSLTGQPGLLYLGALYIEQITGTWPAKAQARGKYHLSIGRDEYITDDLTVLERKLYEFAVGEGYIAGEEDERIAFLMADDAQ